MSDLIGYARVSTHDQRLERQLDALTGAGCAEPIFCDVGSGSIAERPELEACLRHLRAGDTLVVWRLDRLGRGLHHLIELIAQLAARQVAFRSVTESIVTATAGGRLQVHLFGALAEFARELIRERTRAGVEAARARGRTGGRPRVVTPGAVERPRRLRQGGELTMTEIAQAVGVSRSALYRHLQQHAACQWTAGADFSGGS